MVRERLRLNQARLANRSLFTVLCDSKYRLRINYLERTTSSHCVCDFDLLRIVSAASSYTSHCRKERNMFSKDGQSKDVKTPRIAGDVWCNGEFIKWNDARVHVMSHVLHYGSSVFEGIRCYETKRGPAVFRLQEHMQRLLNSAKIYRMDMML